MNLAVIDLEPAQQELVLDSNLRNIVTLDRVLSELQDQYAITQENFETIWLVLQEAVTNAIRHGNQNDPSKQVSLNIEIRDERFLCFTVKDEGKGFDPDAVPDPTAPDRIEEPNGRGVFLMRKLADKVEYSNKGNTVCVWFDLYRN